MVCPKKNVLNTKIGLKIIWNNKNISVDSNTLFYQELYNKGIIFVGDLFKNGQLIPVNELKISFNLHTDFITLLGIYSAIPRQWKIKMLNERQTRPYNIRSEEVQFLIKEQKPNRHFYWCLVNEKANFPEKLLEKWKISFPTITRTDLQQAFILPYKVTQETKIRNFQFKFLHRILPNNNLLHKMKIKDSNLCVFCKQEIDIVNHMFWDCTVTKTFISKVKQYLEHKLGQEFNLRKDELFMGILGGQDYRLYNHIYLLLKFYIFRCFVTECKPSDSAFINYMDRIEETERYIAKVSQQLDKHADKWRSFFEVV